MKKKIRKIIIAVMFVMLMTTNVYAQLDAPYIEYWEDGIPYDADDNPIVIWSEETVWCVDRTREENAYILLDEDYNILDETEVPYDSDVTDTNDNGYTASEGEETGTINITVTLPEEAQGYDVLVTLTSDENTIQYRLNSASDYQRSESIPAGTYAVANCYIDGDTTLVYQADYDDTVTVTASNGSALTITFYSDVEMVDIEEAESAEAAESTKSNKGGWILLGVIAFAAIIFLIPLIKVFIANKRG